MSRTVTGWSLALSNPRAPQLNELAKPERPVGKLTMRNSEIGIADALFFEQNDVQIECTRTPPAVSHPAGRLLDSHQLSQQFAGGELGLDRDHLIQKGSLLHGSDWRSLLNPALANQARLRQLGDRAT